MAILIVVNNPANWPLTTPGVEVVSARSYISETKYSRMKGVKVFNLCKSYRYQCFGYYVSLLAEARQHKPMPSITTIQDLKSPTMMRLADEQLEELIHTSLARLSGNSFTLSIYFGRNLARRYDTLARRLFNTFPAPLLRATFARKEHWELTSIQPISTADIPADHREFVVECAEDYFSGKRRVAGKKAVGRYDLAILYDRNEQDCPSSHATIEKFEVAARRAGLDVEIIGKDDYGKLAEFDALFIRETTMVNHHTYRFARRAAAEGLVVIDDPESIVRCSNKVFLAEALETNGIRTPRTLIVHKDNIEDIPLYVGFPCVLKQPDSAFSVGVIRVDEPADLEPRTREILAKSDLVIAQEYLPSSYDWRVGVLDGKALFVCKYHMVKGHWQIAQAGSNGKRKFGRVEGVPVDKAPAGVVKAAVRAAKEFGTGLYGVDIKQIGSKVYVIEVNDNPNIDHGCEDLVLGDRLYDKVVGVFVDRIRKLREGRRTKARAGKVVRSDLSVPGNGKVSGEKRASRHKASRHRGERA